MYTIRLGDRAKTALAEHLDIIRAFEHRAGELASELMQRHIEGLARYVEDNRGLFPWGPLK
jgi:DNA-binding GntR family transcriptional regulator